MKIYYVWLLVASVSAVVTPNRQQVPFDLKDVSSRYLKDELASETESAETSTSSIVRNVLDDALEAASHAWRTTASAASEVERHWLNNFFSRPVDDDADHLPKDLSQLSPVYRLFPPRHPPSNNTIYELIAASKYTTILAKIINEDEELVQLLNSTRANHTVFAPTDEAFKKIPHHHHHEPSKELIRAVMRYHIAPGIYTAPQIFHSHTVPTVLESPDLGDKLPQRLAVRVRWKGLTVNYYSRIVAIDIAGSNGVIHGIDSVLLPPPHACTLLEIVPTQFSTFALGILTSGLASNNTTPATLLSSEHAHHGGTVFAPSNAAFQKLGLKINAFLFSPCGHKYLRALLQYHVVPNRTLFSDVYYSEDGQIKPLGVKGFTHLDLPTLLQDRSLAVDVARYGPYASLKINGHQRVAFEDALARDGNIHIVDHVLIPPRKVDDSAPDWTGNEDELTVTDLKSRLADFVDDDGEEWGHGEEL
ncbi:FAS1 domain-containing protein [Aspergillus ambiguus]|uniref:fasciclin domain-containing protein n=1 Tax=Aspergillus ambiguus TaxID=176160 RepID=UPI003CCD2A1E